jgi:chromosome segregation ATPase
MAVLAGGVVGPVQAGSAVKWGDFSASAGDRLTATSMEAGNQYVLKSSSLSVGDIEALQAEQKRSTSALQSLTSKVEGQGRELDELKRKGGSAASAGDSQLSSLKSTIQDQKSTIDRQKSDIDALKRSLDDLKRSVESLSSKVK